MVISHRYRFIFIKTAKTAGTSLEVFLSGVCGEEDVLTPIFPHVEPHRPRNADGFYNHMPAHAVRERLPREVWEGYFKFCVERNPWDKTLSHYHARAVRLADGLTFDRYLLARDYCLNHPLYTDPDDGRVIVDRVLRYENLMGDFAEVCRRLGIPFDGDLGVRAKSDCRSDRRPYREVYTAAQRKLIQRLFAREIELHGYRF